MTMRPDVISAEEWAILRQALGLSLLQTEILKRIFRGRSYQEIAREMAIRPRMVRAQMALMYRTFGVSNRVQLVLHVLMTLREYWEERGEYLSK